MRDVHGDESVAVAPKVETSGKTCCNLGVMMMQQPWTTYLCRNLVIDILIYGTQAAAKEHQRFGLVSC